MNHSENHFVSHLNTNPSGSSQPHTPTESSTINIMAIMAYLGFLVFVPLLVEKKNAFVRFHTKQGLALLIIYGAAWVADLMISWVAPLAAQTFLDFLITIIFMLVLIASIVGIIHVLREETKPLPGIGSWAQKIQLPD